MKPPHLHKPAPPTRPKAPQRNPGEILFERSDQPVESEWRRAEARKCSMEPIDLEFNGQTMMATAYDASPHSLGVRTKQKVPAGSLVRVRISCEEGDWCTAKVVHCTDTFGGYRIGMVFE